MRGRGKKVHQPKKKHLRKPRKEPIVPLTDAERRFKARQEFQKAKLHLSEAEQMAAARIAPNACAHSAYYAMHHCAAAALLAAGGVGKRKDVPLSHEHIIEHYGNLVKTESGFLANSGLTLSRALTGRTVADYNLDRSVTLDEAQAAARDAKEFVDACAAKWNLGDLVA